MEFYKELSAKIDGLHELTESKFAENKECHENIIKRMDIANCRTSKSEERIGALENWRWWLVGIFTTVTFIFNYYIDK
jgi:hypothetical protein